VTLLRGLPMKCKALLKIMADAGGPILQQDIMVKLPFLRGEWRVLSSLKSQTGAICKQAGRMPNPRRRVMATVPVASTISILTSAHCSRSSPKRPPPSTSSGNFWADESPVVNELTLNRWARLRVHKSRAVLRTFGNGPMLAGGSLLVGSAHLLPLDTRCCNAAEIQAAADTAICFVARAIAILTQERV
jgi:hypothetical protein